MTVSYLQANGGRAEKKRRTWDLEWPDGEVFSAPVKDSVEGVDIVVPTFKFSITYDKDDVSWFRYMYRYALGRTAEMPPQGRLNAGQKLHHSTVIVFSAVIAVSGLVLWFLKADLSVTMLSLTAMIHDLSMLVLTLLLVGHIYFSYVYTAWSSMATGYVSKDDMEMEHSKWVEELDHEGAEGSSS